jgi:hypothetical protein
MLFADYATLQPGLHGDQFRRLPQDFQTHRLRLAHDVADRLGLPTRVIAAIGLIISRPSLNRRSLLSASGGSDHGRLWSQRWFRASCSRARDDSGRARFAAPTNREADKNPVLRKVKLHPVTAKHSTRHQIVCYPAYRLSALAPKSFNSDQMSDCRRRGLLDNPKLVFDKIQYREF